MRALKPILWQHWLALIIVFAIVAVTGYEVKRTPPAYLESATVSFILPRPLNNLTSETVLSSSLITSDAVISQIMMSPEYQRLVHEAGGTAGFDYELINSNDDEYPEYKYPLATLTIQSSNRVAVQRTFAVALRQLKQLVMRQQVQLGVPPRSRVSVGVVGDTGPIRQQGSTVRSLGALALLAAIAVSMITTWLDRHRSRLVATLTRSPPEPIAAGIGSHRHRPMRSRLDGGA